MSPKKRSVKKAAGGASKKARVTASKKPARKKPPTVKKATAKRSTAKKSSAKKKKTTSRSGVAASKKPTRSTKKASPKAAKAIATKKRAGKKASGNAGKGPVKKKAHPASKGSPKRSAVTPKAAGPKKNAVKKKGAKAKLARKTPVADKSVQRSVAKSIKGVATEGKESVRAKSRASDLEKFRYLLLSLRARLLGDVTMMSKEALGPDGNTDNHAPLHPAEVGTHSFEQEFTLNLLSSDGDRLEQIEAALEKFAHGSYGACEECGGRIPKARLEVIPDTPFCVKCATKLEG